MIYDQEAYLLLWSLLRLKVYTGCNVVLQGSATHCTTSGVNEP